MVRVRFAPSPTGYVHIGNIRIALFNWLYALCNKGQFILRYDDTDAERSKQEYIDAILEDINWLGMHPDEIYYQSKRFARYAQVAEILKSKGLLYPCFESQHELELSRKIKSTRGLPPIYDRKSLKLSEEEKNKLIEQGIKPHWRFLLPNFKDDEFNITSSPIKWHDEVKGEQTIDLASLSDPVLIREDGTYLYSLPSVVDDIDMGITHIIRGDDHITNSATQIAIFKALDAEVPKLGHINLLTTGTGEGLSKRSGALSIRSLRESGFQPMAISCLATLIGSSENVVAYPDMASLAKHFDLANISKSAAKFSVEDLERLNENLIHDMSFAQVQDQLKNLAIEGPQAERFWNVIRGNLVKISEASYWWDIATNKNLSFITEHNEFFNIAASLLSDEKFDENSWSNWTKNIKLHTNKKGKELYAPLRQALTGKEHGPELSSFFPLLSRDLVLHRLQNTSNS